MTYYVIVLYFHNTSISKTGRTRGKVASSSSFILGFMGQFKNNFNKT